jgi:hypothetical protein
MRLQDFLNAEVKYSMDAIAKDPDLTAQVQVRLIALGLLDPPIGKFGPISSQALKNFQEIMQSGEPDYLGKVTAEQLIETKTETIQKKLPPLKLEGQDLATRIAKYMQKKNYTISTGPNEMNIVYVEGMNTDGTLNSDAPNEFNDLRLVFEVKNGKPQIVGKWEATTEPGTHYTQSPMNAGGAARIKFGQYKAWRFGLHGVSVPHRALVQVSPVSVHRDANKDYSRSGDFIDTGIFAINQHWGYDYPRNDVNMAGAGCLVGRRTAGHQEFLKIIERDPRYLATPLGAPIFPGDPRERTYVFVTTILAGDDLEKEFPG